ncbi:fatty acid--CoA ligase [Stakelama tenebrarum]|uniref:3-methylmercaptopropionyl-CoA ligase n=1 Tax=Stakelama tenebrarum TaxID=2711215 RepID=A0A6G6Y825_9SPHN|nr:fatty acid--CoA ligase [Sphingosinithalassobacter tenebrarum]QIG81070.1 fatty acid--CoA ligase [Sphingosinithalassobacter tenebrarum]
MVLKAAKTRDPACEPIDFDAMPRLGDIPAYHALRRPLKAATVFEGHATSWATLDARANRVANALLAEGCEPGDRIGFVGKGCDSFFELLFGAAKAGMVLVPVQWRLAAPEIAQILEDAEVRLLFLAPDQFDKADGFCALPAVKRCIAMGDGSDLPGWEEWRDAASSQTPDIAVDPDDVALQLYTSGTTGTPKGVMLSHANILSGRREGMGAKMPWNEWLEDDVNLVPLPLGHIGGVGWAIVGYFNGATTIVHSEFVPQKVLDALAHDGVSKMFLVPTAIQMLLMMPGVRELEFPRLRYMLYGASPIALDLLREATEVFGCGFAQQYGATETCGTIVYLPPEDHESGGTERMRSAGLPMPGVEIRVVHPISREPLDARDVGEVETRSVANMVGYWKRGDATRETLNADGWLRTGDAGYLDEDGYLYIHDRFKDMICTGAENVYPAEVESAIYGHPAVQEVAVIGVPDAKWGEAVKAVIVPKPGETVTAEDIIAYARERIAGFKVPKSVDFADALPRTASGKVMRRALRDPYWEGRDRAVN